MPTGLGARVAIGAPEITVKGDALMEFSQFRLRYFPLFGLSHGGSGKRATADRKSEMGVFKYVVSIVTYLLGGRGAGWC